MSYSLLPDTLARIDHRLQFVLGPRYLEGFEAWQRIEVAGGLRLTSHPDLSVTNFAAGSASLTLLGYLLDPQAPMAGNEQVLAGLARSLAAGEDLFSCLEGFGGRYLLIADAGAPLIVGDAVGTLQLFHATVKGELWCAAQPHLLAEHLGLAEDPEALAFMSWLQTETDEPSWPVSATAHTEVARLVPNHFLDLRRKSSVRYWPREPREEGATHRLRPQITARLEGLLAAASQRFDLALGVSAGYDSRVLLAASRRVADQIVYYTGQGAGRGPGHPDIAIPRAMLRNLGVEHDVIVTSGPASPQFSEVFRRSISFSHGKREAGQQTQLEAYRLDRVAVLGNASEIGRNHLRTSGRTAPVVGWPTAEQLALLMAMDHPFAVRHFQRWLDEVGDTKGYDVLDLFFWEHRHGSWFAQNCSQFVIGWQDVFLPFNSRALLVDLLSVPLIDRADRGKTLYVSLVRDLWPELLAYPINPVGRFEDLRRRGFKVLRNLKRTLLGQPQGKTPRPAQ